MGALCLSVPATYLAERTYICQVLFGEFLGIEWRLSPEERPDVAVRLDGQPGEIRLAEGLFAMPEHRWLTAASMPPEPLAWWDRASSPVEATTVAPRLPVLYGQPLPDGSFCSVEPELIRLGIDILGSSFFMLSRYEEALGGARDEHLRFPAAASLAGRAGFLDRPIVNEYLEVLWWAMQRLWPGLRRKGRQGRFLLSHDVDHPLCTAGMGLLRVGRSVAGDLLRRSDPVLAGRRILSYAQTRRTPEPDLCNNFAAIMDESESRGVVSAFNFIADKTDDTYDAEYAIEDPFIRRLLRQVHQRGHEIGLHPSYNSYDRPAQIRREFERLRRCAEEEGIQQGAWGGRQHYLRWANPVTWRGWEEAGLQYDSTLGFADQPGFRAGVCYEYPVFDLHERRPFRLRERPLVVMEVTLFEYLEASAAESLARIVELQGRCALFDGDFTLLWHNSRLLQNWEMALYRQVLDACSPV